MPKSIMNSSLAPSAVSPIRGESFYTVRPMHTKSSSPQISITNPSSHTSQIRQYATTQSSSSGCRRFVKGFRKSGDPAQNRILWRKGWKIMRWLMDMDERTGLNLTDSEEANVQKEAEGFLRLVAL
ncbi:hypothetical protein IG631_13199 [Alternaria alternata]|nr:hypothetical protein IG631_13199 [Alternaria alternata]